METIIALGELEELCEILKARGAELVSGAELLSDNEPLAVYMKAMGEAYGNLYEELDGILATIRPHHRYINTDSIVQERL